MSINRRSGHLLAMTLTLLALAAPAHAVDGCKVLLCFAGNWRDISECRPEVEQALRDQAKGKGWPTCKETQANASMQTPNSVVSRTVYAQSCPFYFRRWTWVVNNEYQVSNNEVYGTWLMTCEVNEVLVLTIDGKPWKNSYLLPDGTSVEEWLPAARAAFPEIGNSPIGLDLVEQAWIDAGAPTTKPSVPANYIDLASNSFKSCPPFNDNPNFCGWYEDGVYRDPLAGPR